MPAESSQINQTRVDPLTPPLPRGGLAPSRSKEASPTFEKEVGGKHTGELFPQLAALSELPEKGAEIDFNRSSLYRAKKPESPFDKFPSIGGVTLAKVLEAVYQLNERVQLSNLELFDAAYAARKKAHQEKLALIEEMVANRKDFDVWGFRKQILEYFGMSLSLLGGAALTAAGTATGNVLVQKYGAAMFTGSALNMGAKLWEYFFGENKVVALTKLLGAVVSGYGGAKGFSVLYGKLPRIASSAWTTSMSFSEYLVNKKNMAVRAQEYALQAKNTRLEFKRETASQERRKLAGGFKMDEIGKLMSAMTRLLDVENRIKSQIVQGKDKG